MDLKGMLAMRTTRTSARGLISRLSRSAGRAAPEAMFEALEGRQFLAATVVNPIADLSIQRNSAATVIDLAPRFDDPNLTGTLLRWNTVQGDFVVEMFDQAGPGRTRTTPLSVANFLQYLNAGRYTNTIFHRSVANFVVQGGGFTRPTANNQIAPTIPTFAQVPNEPGNSNVRGTIAYAKLGPDAPGGGPNSATSQFFFNLGDNSANLNNQNGGFTVFARVIGNGMAVVDAIAALPRVDLRPRFPGQGSDPFVGAANEVPIRGTLAPSVITPDNYASVNAITVTPELTYTVTSGNPAVVSATIQNNQVRLVYGANRTGVSNITVRATSADGSFVEDVFTVRVGNVPTVSSVTANPAFIAVPGANTTLTAVGVSDLDNNVARVQFFRDSNSNNQLDDADTLLGEDTSAAGGYTLTTPTTGFGGGANRVFARVVDNDQLTSSVVFTTVTVNQRPTITNLSSNLPSVLRPAAITLTANGLADVDGTVTGVEFFRDANANGSFDEGVDLLLGTDNNPAGGFSLSFATTGFPGGNVNFFARAIDNQGARSTTATTSVGINSVAPTLTALTLAPTVTTRPSTITLTATGAADTDGTVAAVEFYRDANANNTFDAGVDVLLGTDSTIGDGFSLQVSSASLAVGVNRLFARARDNDGVFSVARSAVITIANVAPTVGSVSAGPNPLPGGTAQVTLTANNVGDRDGTVARVQFFRDTNNNGVLDLADQNVGEDNNSAGGFSVTFSASNLSGSVRWFARATDNDNALSLPALLVTRVSTPPTVTSLTSSPTTVTRPGNVTLTANGVAATQGVLSRVDFYRDNGDNVFDPAVDTLLGSDNSATGGWTLTFSSAQLGGGVNRFFARARDTLGSFSSTVTATVTVNNAAPTITGLTATPSVLPDTAASILLTATGAADADGSIARVQFFRDSNTNGVLDANDVMVGEDNNPAGGFTLTLPGTGLAGTVRFFARATDNDGTNSAAVTSTVRINAAPTVASVTATPGAVTRPANVTFTANGVVDPDGTVVSVEFVQDLNNNGQIDNSDRVLGVDNSIAGGWTLVLSSRELDAGVNGILARATDNLGARSAVAQTTVNVTNLTPTVASITVTPNPSINPNTNVTITANTVVDPDGAIVRVDFFADNGDGVFNATTDTLLGSDSLPTDGFSLTRPGGQLPGGTRLYFARAVDDDNAFSNVVQVSARINNSPVIGGFQISAPTVARPAPVTFTAQNVTDDGTVARVVFFFDSNQDGQFQDGQDEFLGEGVQNGVNWSFTLPSSSVLNTGNFSVLAIALDNDNALSAPLFRPLTVT